jgi:hypothetical protein
MIEIESGSRVDRGIIEQTKEISFPLEISKESKKISLN